MKICKESRSSPKCCNGFKIIGPKSVIFITRFSYRNDCNCFGVYSYSLNAMTRYISTLFFTRNRK